MGFLKGRLTFRRYRVNDPLPDDFRDRFEDALTDHAFREPGSVTKGEETVGWVRTDNLLETDFSNRDKWLYTHYLMAGMRLDKKTLPTPLVRAMIEKRVESWCEENGRARAPAEAAEARAAERAALRERAAARRRRAPQRASASRRARPRSTPA